MSHRFWQFVDGAIPSRRFSGLLLLCLVANVWPLWSVRYLPLGDLGGHLELMDVAARLHSADTLYESTFAINGWVNPNSLTHKVAALLHPIFSTVVIAKLLLTWYVVGTPLALLTLARVLGRNKWAVFFPIAMTYNAIVNVGFLDFLISVPLIWFSIALAADRRTTLLSRRGALLILSTTLLFFGHAIAYAFGALAALFALALRNSWRSTASKLLLFLPSASCMGFWIARKLLLNEATATGRTFAGESGLGAYYEGLPERVDGIYHWTLQFFRDESDERLVVGLVAGAVLIVIGGVPTRARLRPISNYGIELMTVSTAVAYLVLPSGFRFVDVVAQRFALLTLHQLPLWTRGRVRGFTKLGTAIAVILSLWYPINVSRQFADFNNVYLRTLPSILEALPDRTRLAYVQWDRENDVVHMGPLWHIPKGIHSTVNGGITSDSFARNSTAPINYQSGQQPPELQGRFWDDPQLPYYDYVLLRATTAPPQYLGDQLELLFHERTWWLYRVERSNLVLH